MKKWKKRMVALSLALVLTMGMTLTVNAASATPVTGSIFGYAYRGTLDVTASYVRAVFTGDAEISNEATPDTPWLEIYGRVVDGQDVRATILGEGVKSCSFYQTYTGGVTYGFCHYKLEGAEVGVRHLYF